MKGTERCESRARYHHPDNPCGESRTDPRRWPLISYEVCLRDVEDLLAPSRSARTTHATTTNTGIRFGVVRLCETHR